MSHRTASNRALPVANRNDQRLLSLEMSQPDSSDIRETALIKSAARGSQRAARRAPAPAADHARAFAPDRPDGSSASNDNADTFTGRRNAVWVLA